MCFRPSRRKGRRWMSSPLLSWYTPAPFYLVRVPLLPFSLFDQLSQQGSLASLTLSENTGEHTAECTTGSTTETTSLEDTWDEALTKCLAFLTDLAHLPDIDLAILLASPSLHVALRVLRQSDTSGQSHQTKQPHQAHQAQRTQRLKVAERLMRYVIRMSTRATPFGLCAGVSLGTFAQESRLTLEKTRQASLRPDMEWLCDLLSRLEETFLSELPVQANPSFLFLGKRGIGQKRGHAHDTEERLWLKITPVVEMIRQVARIPIPYVDLKQQVLASFPQATSEMVDQLLHTLYRLQVICTALPPVDEVYPLRHVLTLLDAVPGARSHLPSLTALQTMLHSVQSAPAVKSVVTAILQQQQELHPTFAGPSLQIDTSVTAQGRTLSHEVGQEAAKAAELLLRLVPYTDGLPSLHHARRLFLERYEEQEVPLLSLFVPQGLFDGLYAKERELDHQDLPQEQQERLAKRAHFLRGLAMQAVNAREQTVDLTPALVERLSLWSPDSLPPPLLDLYLQLFANSLEAVDRGEWHGWVTLLPHGMRAFHRFSSLFDEQELAMVEQVIRTAEAQYPDHLCASLACVPPRVRDLNVTHGPSWSPYVLPINCASPRPPAQTLLLEDIVVYVRSGRFVLSVRSHHKTLRVMQHHMLAFTHLPPIARFLLEASQENEPFPCSFSWGTASLLPFLPRLTTGKLIVSAAQWRLSEEALECSASETTRGHWFRAVQQWRTLWNVPRFVYLLDGEDRLLLDLEHVLMVETLRQQLVRSRVGSGSLVLQEALGLPHAGQGWLQDHQGQPYMADMVIPLVRTRDGQMRSSPFPLPLLSRGVLPGERLGENWLTVKLYGPDGLVPLVLAGQMLTFLQSHRHLVRQWFFVRYHDSHDHVRLRLHLDGASLRGQLLQELWEWGSTLRSEGVITDYVLGAYEREVERYGGPEAMTWVERLFCANSEAICQVLLLPKDPYPLLFYAAYTLDCLWASWGYSLAARAQALRRLRRSGKESPLLRKRRRDLLSFLEKPPGVLPPLFEAHHQVVVEGSREIHLLAEQHQLWRAEEDILWSLSHMACNRLLGYHRDLEQDAYEAWEASIHMRLHRP